MTPWSREFFSPYSLGTLENIFSGNHPMKTQTPSPKKPDSGIPNWLFYSGIGMVLSLGAAKVLFGILRLYR
jgi:hypothetical protein